MSGRDLTLVVFVMAIWGFNYTMIKLGVSEVNPMLIAAGRFFCAAFPMVLFVRHCTGAVALSDWLRAGVWCRDLGHGILCDVLWVVIRHDVCAVAAGCADHGGSGCAAL